MNRVILTGRATNNMELFGSDKNVGRVTIAVNGLNRDDTSFVPVVCFGKTAENGNKYIYKGMMIAVDGRLNQSSYEKDGKKYNSIEVIADRIEYLDKLKEQPQEMELKTKTTTQETIEYEDSDLPW